MPTLLSWQLAQLLCCCLPISDNFLGQQVLLLGETVKLVKLKIWQSWLQILSQRQRRHCDCAQICPHVCVEKMPHRHNYLPCTDG